MRSACGWHYDREDIFIAQTSGQKQYHLRRNTVDAAREHAPCTAPFERETSPVLACTLLPGDWLYVPRCWWHMGYATRDSLSLSIGVASGRIGSAHAQAGPDEVPLW